MIGKWRGNLLLWVIRYLLKVIMLDISSWRKSFYLAKYWGPWPPWPPGSVGPVFDCAVRSEKTEKLSATTNGAGKPTNQVRFSKNRRDAWVTDERLRILVRRALYLAYQFRRLWNGLTFYRVNRSRVILHVGRIISAQLQFNRSLMLQKFY